MRWAEQVEAYLAELAEDGRRPHTLRGYRSDLAGLIARADEHGGLLTQAVVAAYLARADELAPATRARQRSVLRGFLRWASNKGLITDDLDAMLPGSPAPQPAPAAVPAQAGVPARAEVEAALGAIPRQADRDQLLFGLLAHLGLRPGEALALRVEDFDEPGECLHVPGRGGIRRRVLVDDSQLLLRLIHWRQRLGRDEGPLFTAAGRATPLRYQSVLARWERYTAAAGVTVRLGDLRRTHAAELLAGGVPERVVRQRLGQHTGPLTGPATGTDTADGDEAIRAWRAQMPTSMGRTRRDESPSEHHQHRRDAG
jgi:integrase